MHMWSLVACGQVADGARDELASRVAELFSSPQFGTGHTSLLIGTGPSASGLHLSAERVPETAAA